MAHASIGPSCALAEFKDGKLTVWTHSQGVFPLRATLAKALGHAAAQRSAASIPKAPAATATTAPTTSRSTRRCWRARPTAGRCALQWMRDDEFKWEPYGPAMTMQRKAAIADGRIVDWNYDVWSQTHNMRPGEPDGINLLASWYLAEPKKPGPARQAAQPSGAGDRNAVPLYELPRQRITHHLIKDNPIRVSALRTLGAYANVFAIESFMDELAAAAGADPVAFRLAHSRTRARAP